MVVTTPVPDVTVTRHPRQGIEMSELVFPVAPVVDVGDTRGIVVGVAGVAKSSFVVSML